MYTVLEYWFIFSLSSIFSFVIFFQCPKWYLYYLDKTIYMYHDYNCNSPNLIKTKPLIFSYKNKQLSIYTKTNTIQPPLDSYDIELDQTIFYINDNPILCLSVFYRDVFCNRKITYNSNYETKEVLYILKAARKQYKVNQLERIKKRYKNIY